MTLTRPGTSSGMGVNLPICGDGEFLAEEDTSDDALGGVAVLQGAETLAEAYPCPCCGLSVHRAGAECGHGLLERAREDARGLRRQIECDAADRSVDLPVGREDDQRPVQDGVVEHQ